jgi:hypothetical protein
MANKICNYDDTENLLEKERSTRFTQLSSGAVEPHYEAVTGEFSLIALVRSRVWFQILNFEGTKGWFWAPLKYGSSGPSGGGGNSAGSNSAGSNNSGSNEGDGSNDDSGEGEEDARTSSSARLAQKGLMTKAELLRRMTPRILPKGLNFFTIGGRTKIILGGKMLFQTQREGNQGFQGKSATTKVQPASSSEIPQSSGDRENDTSEGLRKRKYSGKEEGQEPASSSQDPPPGSPHTQKVETPQESAQSNSSTTVEEVPYQTSHNDMLIIIPFYPKQLWTITYYFLHFFWGVLVFLYLVSAPHLWDKLKKYDARRYWRVKRGKNNSSNVNYGRGSRGGAYNVDEDAIAANLVDPGADYIYEDVGGSNEPGVNRKKYRVEMGDRWIHHRYTPGSNPHGEDLTLFFRQAMFGL